MLLAVEGDGSVVSADAAAEVVAALVSEALIGDLVDVVSVVVGIVCRLLLDVVNVLEVLDTLEVVEGFVAVVDGGAKSTILGIAVGIMTLAVIVLCLFGMAPAIPTHIETAFAATASIKISTAYKFNEINLLLASSPVHKPTSFSSIIHCTAPSPTVKPLVLLLVQRQSNVGFCVQMSVGKLFSRKDTKHVCAQAGMKFVSSLLKDMDASTRAEKMHNRRRVRISLGQHDAILGGAIQTH